MKQKTALIGVALACIGGGVIAFSQMPPPQPASPDLHDMLATPKTQMQMQLHGANRNAANGKSMSGKTLGFEHYVDSGRTLRHIHNIFESGIVEHIYLRPDGTKEASRDYFPAKDGEEQAQMRSRAKFAEDGKTYTSHDVYNDKGILERQGRLLPSKEYQQVYFCEDGVHQHRVRLFMEGKAFKSEKLYSCKTHELIAEIFPGNYTGQVTVKVLRPDGTRSALLTKDYSGIGGEVFAEDGETVIAWFRNDYGSETIRYFAGKDKLSQQWVTSFGRLKISVHDLKTDKRILLQEWKERPGENQGEKRYLLVKVTEFDKNGNWKREIDMTGDGQSPATVSFPLGTQDLHTLKVPALPGGYDDLEKLRNQMKLLHTLDQNARVVKTQLSIENQSWNDTEQEKPTLDKVQIAPELLQLPAHQPMPDFNDLGPDRVYDYEAGTSPSAPAVSYPYGDWGP